MSNNLLPSCDKTIYETHFWMRREYPFIFHRDVLHRDGQQFTPSVHVNLELIHILSGNGQIVFNGTIRDVLPGDIAILNPYTTHTILTSDTVTTDCLIVDHDFLLDNGIDLSQLEFIPVLHDPKAAALFLEFYEERQFPTTFHRATIRTALLQLMLYLCKNYSSTKNADMIPSGIMERIWSAVEFMKENLGKKVSLEQIAAKVGLSKYYFLRLFKSHTGYTVNTYLTLLRCDRAKQLLRLGDYSIQEVAEQCGFENHSYFSKVFKEHTGQTPSAVMKK